MATFMDSGTGYSNLALKIEIIVLHKKLQFFVVFVLVDNRTFAGGGEGGNSFLRICHFWQLSLPQKKSNRVDATFPSSAKSCVTPKGCGMIGEGSFKKERRDLWLAAECCGKAQWNPVLYTQVCGCYSLF